jgi:hypothetical protein
MRLNSKVTWGLAWAGLAVVLAVPSADYLTGQFGAKANTVSKTALLTSTTDPVKKATGAAPVVTKTASVTTKVTKTGVSIVPAGTTTAGAPVLDPVNKYVQTGKPLPDYISGGDTSATASAKTPVANPATADETTQVATVDPAPVVVPPVPFPARPPDIIRSGLPKAGQPAAPIAEEDSIVTGDIGGDAGVPPDQLDVTTGPVPPAGLPSDWRAARDRKLTKYLEQQGLIDGASPDGRSSASVTVVQRPSSDYDPNGFYLSDGPNNARAARRARIEQMYQDDQGNDSGFTLF